MERLHQRMVVEHEHLSGDRGIADRRRLAEPDPRLHDDEERERDGQQDARRARERRETARTPRQDRDRGAGGERVEPARRQAVARLELSVESIDSCEPSH